MHSLEFYWHYYKDFIRNRYGDDTYQNILKHQKVAKSLEMVRRDIRFLARCKKKVIPIHCSIRVDDLRPKPIGRLQKQPRVNF